MLPSHRNPAHAAMATAALSVVAPTAAHTPLADRRSTRVLRLLLATVLAATGACAAPSPARAPVPDVGVDAAPSAAAMVAPAAAREDLRALYETLQAAHYDLHARRSREQYDARYAQLRAALTKPVPRDQLQLQFQGFVAYGNVAHASIAPPLDAWEAFRSGGGKAFPLLLRVDDGRVRVLEDLGGSPGVSPGDEVLAVDGREALAWLQPLRAQLSADNERLAHALMEPRLPLLAWVAYGERAAFELETLDAAGVRQALTVPALSRSDLEAAQPARPPRFELDASAREARLLDGGVAYLRPGPFYDHRPEAPHPWDTAAFQRFVDDAFARFIQAGASDLLIDLRDNPGGDNSFSDLMLAWFADRPFRFSPGFDIRVSQAAIDANRERLRVDPAPDSTSARLAAAYAGAPLGSRITFPIAQVAPRAGQRFGGCVHVLVNRHSYSNAVSVAAIAQDYGFASVLGEETADLASTYGAGETFTLPRTGIPVSFPKARILRPSGDPAPRGVIPDVAIQTPLVAGHDVVLARALEIIGSRRGSGQR